MDTAAPAPLLEVRDLRKTFLPRSSSGAIRRGAPTPAVDGVSLTVGRGQAVGVVGESGCGKTTFARCLVRLVVPDSGEVVFDGSNILGAGGRELREVRRRMQMIYQDPYSSLNPRMSVADCISEAGRAHGLIGNGYRDRFVAAQLERVGLSRQLAGKRPRELSGGQRQRVAIARGLAVGPDLLIADEAVSALDVSVQAQILNLFEDLKKDLNLSLVFIAHQLSVVAHVCDYVNVMYLGRIVESGPTAEVFRRPRHPYTTALMEAHPDVVHPRRDHRPAVTGEATGVDTLAGGCSFRNRCPNAVADCAATTPVPISVGDRHEASCLRLAEAVRESGALSAGETG